MTHSKVIRLRFQRDAVDSAQDDTIRIMSDGVKQVKVSYAYYRDPHPIVRVMNYEMLTAYLNSMFMLIAADMHPFLAVQIDLPLMPSVCLPPSRLSWDGHYINEQVRLQCSAWDEEDKNNIIDPNIIAQNTIAPNNIASPPQNEIG
jgi:hypothetical protein